MAEGRTNGYRCVAVSKAILVDFGIVRDVSKSVDELFRSGLDKLSKKHGRLLNILCASQRPFKEKEILAISPFPAAETHGLLSDLFQMRILTKKPAQNGPVTGFHHWHLREILYQKLRGRRRCSVHRLLGQALESMGASVRELHLRPLWLRYSHR